MSNITKKRLFLPGLAAILSVAIVCQAIGLRSHRRPVPAPDQLLLAQPLTVKWRYQSDQTLDLTPATDGAAVYLPMAGGIILALNGADGQLRWKSEAGGELSASPVADHQAVYVSTAYSDTLAGQPHQHGALRALGKEAGVTLWMRTINAPIRGSLAVGEKAIFGGSVDGSVYAFDKTSGLVLWINQFPAAFASQPIVAGSTLYIGSEDGTLLALDQATGNVNWKYKTKGPIRGPAAVSNRMVYFGSHDGYVYAFNESRADLAWHRRTGAAVQSVAAADTRLLVASLDNFVYCYALNGGADLWRRQLPGRISAQPLTASDGALFTPLSSDAAIVLGLKDGKPVNTLLIGEENSTAASPVIASGVILLTVPHGIVAFSHPAESPKPEPTKP